MRMRFFSVLLALCLAAAWSVCADASQRVDLGIITVKDKATAEKLRGLLQKGGSFEQLAKEYSVGPTASRGGRLGRVPIKRLRTEYRQILKTLEPGKPSKVVPTEEGYNILMVFDPVRLAPTQPGKPSGPEVKVGSASKVLLARQAVLAGMEALERGELDLARSKISQALGLNPRHESAPFFLEMIDCVKTGKCKKEAVSLFAQGFMAMLEGEPQKARDFFRKAGVKDQKLWQADLFEANMLAGMGKRNEASMLWMRVLEKNPKAALAHISLGLLANEENKPELARKHFNQALAIDPDLGLAHHNLGSMDLYQGKFKDAEIHLRAAVTANPENAEIHNDLGLVYAYTGRPEQALKSYERALELNPEYSAVHVNIGTLYAGQKKYNQAIDEFNKALAIEPELGDAHSNLAAAYILMQDWDKAIKHADIALAMHYPVPAPILKALEGRRKKAK